MATDQQILDDILTSLGSDSDSDDAPIPSHMDVEAILEEDDSDSDSSTLDRPIQSVGVTPAAAFTPVSVSLQPPPPPVSSRTPTAEEIVREAEEYSSSSEESDDEQVQKLKALAVRSVSAQFCAVAGDAIKMFVEWFCKQAEKGDDSEDDIPDEIAAIINEYGADDEDTDGAVDPVPALATSDPDALIPSRLSFSSVGMKSAAAAFRGVPETTKQAEPPIPATPVTPAPKLSRMETVAAEEKQRLKAGNDTLRSPLQVKRRNMSAIQSQFGRSRRGSLAHRASITTSTEPSGIRARMLSEVKITFSWLCRLRNAKNGAFGGNH
jgi:hypothetical protein